jgi:subtilisin family serine protease
MMKFSWVALVTFSFILAACGKAQPESDGVITVINHEKVVIRDQAQQEQVCANQYCEPNYILTEAFGSRRVSDPAPAPIPIPVPTVRPTATPVVNPTATPIATATPVHEPSTGFNSKDHYDYSRAAMNLQEAWNITEGDPEVIVAVIDSGIDLTHPDLKDNLWTNPAEAKGLAGVDNDGNGYKNDVHGYDFYYSKGDPTDQTGHGTHVAGIIAALKNDLGSVGVAPKVKIMALRFIGPSGTGSTSDAIDAIYYAIRNGAKVISASWGGTGYSSYLAQAIKDAQAAGIVFVAAAGNSSKDTSSTPYYPANYDGVVSVASSGEGDYLASYSNYSSNAVTIAAPGDQIYSTYLKGGYEYLSGTSMAAPQVSGAIALALSKNKSFQPNYLTSALCQSSDAVLTKYTRCGRINIGRLLKNL